MSGIYTAGAFADHEGAEGLEDESAAGIYTAADELERCELCGEPLVIDLFEVWLEDRSFMIETCCEGMHEAVVDELQGGSREPWIRDLFARYGIDVRQVYAEDGWLGLDFGLELHEISRDEAKAFVRVHHRHTKPPAGWKWGHAVYNGSELIGVAMVGRPVARLLDTGDVVEINRVCVNASLSPALTWNACSMLYGAARREAIRRKISRVVTYTLESENGTSLKAAGFVPVAKTRGGSWDRRGRRRTDSAPTCPKVRWEAQAFRSKATRAGTVIGDPSARPGDAIDSR